MVTVHVCCFGLIDPKSIAKVQAASHKKLNNINTYLFLKLTRTAAWMINWGQNQVSNV